MHIVSVPNSVVVFLIGAAAYGAMAPAAHGKDPTRPIIASTMIVPVARQRAVTEMRVFDAPLSYSMPRQASYAAPLRTREQPRLALAHAVHDPLQFAGVRALRLDRGRYRPSQLDAKLELKLSGDMGGVDTHLGVAGGVPRLLQKALR